MAANRNTPMGLVPVKHGSGGLIRSSRYEIAGALASNIYRGSAVIAVNTNKRINIATAGARLRGVFQGCTYITATGDVKIEPRWPTGQTVKTGSVVEALVFDDPDILFSVQVSGTPGLAAGDVGNFADLVISGGTAATGQSSDMLDQSTLTATLGTGGQLFIEELQRRAYGTVQNAYGQYAKAVVRINEHDFRGSTTAGNAQTAI